MNATSQRPKGQDRILSALNIAIEALNLAKEASGPTPAKAVFGSVSVLLVMIRDSKANKTDYVELGLACADVCTALNRGLNGRQSHQLGRSVSEAIEQLIAAVDAIQKSVEELSKRNVLFRHFHAKNDKDAIAAWKSDLLRILHVFHTELGINTHVVAVDTRLDVADTKDMVSDIHRVMVERQEKTGAVKQPTQMSPLGELPPPRPRACFGRDDLIEKIVGLAESLTPVALIGAGGIGKTSVALVALHHDRIKKRFGNDRRFIRCDKFPASCSHFLARLSKVIGAGIENPADLTPLRPSLSSRKMIIIFDNCESILDPQGADGREIYQVVEELSQFDNICLVITSRITTIPPNCETLKIPTLSTEAGCDAFYNIYKRGERSDSVDDILKQLDFHPLSITLLATVAHQNDWDNERLIKEWGKRQTGVLRTEHQTSLAATINLSLSSPMFKELGPDALGLLEVIAFYPQGVDEDSLDWLFPSISDISHTFDRFCILSLTHRTDGFITMLAPLRDHLRPKDPTSSLLLGATKDHYFTRLSASLNPTQPGFKDARWIMSEDVNVEYLLDVFISANPGPSDIWGTCANFIQHLEWLKPRPTVLRAKVEGLPDNHLSKPECLLRLGMLAGIVGNHAERTRLLSYALKLWREHGNDKLAAFTLEELSNANHMIGRYKEGIEQAKEALEIYERHGETVERASCLNFLARSLLEDGQLDAAEEAAVRAIQLVPEEGQEFLLCRSHRNLGDIYRTKGEREKAIHHSEVALGIATIFNWNELLFWIHLSLAELFLDENGFNDAHFHIEQLRPYTLENTYYQGRAAILQAMIWYRQHQLENATSGALLALDIFMKIGAPEQEFCRSVLQTIEQTSNACSVPSSTPKDPCCSSDQGSE